MGCDPILCEAAIKNLKSQDIMALLDWIQSNEDKVNHWQKWLQEHKDEPVEEKKEAQGQKIPIETLINMDDCEYLIKKGHKKTIAQKALLLSRIF